MGKICYKTKEEDKRIGRALRVERQIKRVSSEWLAEQLGVGTKQVWKYENGINRVSVSTLCLIADALGVQRDYLFHKVTTDAKR